MQSDAETVKEYLNELPPERREAIKKVREVVLENLPEGMEEAMNWGMITYQVPLEEYPDTYNNKPLMYAALASQKNHMSLYLTSIYSDEDIKEEFEKEYRATGKRYDVGKSCVRFRKLDDLPLDVIADAIASTNMKDFIEQTRKAGSSHKRAKSK